MCGFVGITSHSSILDRGWLTKGCDTLSHRGPDDSGVFWSEDYRVGLAHRRLTVIDLSSAGHQPMVDISGQLTIVFNGEIYNYIELRSELISKGHTFRSNSDTEVILAAYYEWGYDCTSHFNGMFSFALFDEKRQEIFLSRDRVGEKPLFYHYENGTLRFASELKALLADNKLSRQINKESLDCFLSMGYVSGDRCILQGFHKLPPAHYLSFNIKSCELKIKNYWRPPNLHETINQVEVDETDLLDELEGLLQDSVNRQLVADVPIGVLLSGGVDSSLITAMAARNSNKVKTFTIRVPGDNNLDETEHARLIARNFNTEHIELEAQPNRVDLLPQLAKQFDEPMADSSMIPTYLVSELVREHCTVALGGDGADELFGGYHHYSRLLWMQSYLGRVPYPLRKFISYTAERLLPVGFKGRNWLQGLGTDLSNGLPLIGSFFDATTRRNLMLECSDWSTEAESFFRRRIPYSTDLLQRATRMDFKNYLAEDILVKVDRTSMLNSLELRAPFLDHRILEFAFGKVPSDLKATKYDKKILLKRLAKRLLPPEFNLQRKQGFSIPLAKWLEVGEFRELFHDVLLDSQCSFDNQVVRDLLKGQDRGRCNGERLYSLVMFELWKREYSVSF